MRSKQSNKPGRAEKTKRTSAPQKQPIDSGVAKCYLVHSSSYVSDTARVAAGRRLTGSRRGSAAGHVATKLFRSQAHSVSSAVPAAAHEADGALDADADPAVSCLLLKRALFVLFNSGLCSSDSVPPTSGLVASPAS